MKAILQSYHQGENRFSKNGGGAMHLATLMHNNHVKGGEICQGGEILSSCPLCPPPLLNEALIMCNFYPYSSPLPPLLLPMP